MYGHQILTTSPNSEFFLHTDDETIENEKLYLIKINVEQSKEKIESNLSKQDEAK